MNYFKMTTVQKVGLNNINNCTKFKYLGFFVLHKTVTFFQKFGEFLFNSLTKVYLQIYLLRFSSS